MFPEIESCKILEECGWRYGRRWWRRRGRYIWDPGVALDGLASGNRDTFSRRDPGNGGYRGKADGVNRYTASVLAVDATKI